MMQSELNSVQQNCRYDIFCQLQTFTQRMAVSAKEYNKEMFS